MKRRDTDIWNELPVGRDEPAPWEEPSRQQGLEYAYGRDGYAPRGDADGNGRGAASSETAASAPAAPSRSDEDVQSGDPAPPKARRPRTVASVLSGDILSRKEVRRAYPYMIFVALLMFFYIANALRSQQIYRDYAALTEQVKALRSHSMRVSSDKMQATRQSNIMMELERRGIPLRESLTPNRVIPRNGTETENDR